MWEVGRSCWNAVCGKAASVYSPLKEPVNCARSYVDWYLLRAVDRVVDTVFLKPFYSKVTGVCSNFQVDYAEHATSLTKYPELESIEKELQEFFELKNKPFLHLGELHCFGVADGYFSKKVTLNQRHIEPAWLCYNAAHEVGGHVVHDDVLKCKLLGIGVILFGAVRTAQVVHAVFQPGTSANFAPLLQVLLALYMLWSVDKQMEVRANLEGLRFLKAKGILGKFKQLYPLLINQFLTPKTQALLENA